MCLFGNPISRSPSDMYQHCPQSIPDSNSESFRPRKPSTSSPLPVNCHKIISDGKLKLSGDSRWLQKVALNNSHATSLFPIGFKIQVHRFISCLLLLFFRLDLNPRNYPGNAVFTHASFFIREHSASADFIQKLCWPLERRQASCGPVSYQSQPQQLLQRLLRLRVRVWLGVDPGHVSEPQKQGRARVQIHPAVQQYADQREHSELGRLQTLARQDGSAAFGEYPLAHHVQFSRTRRRLQRLRARQLHRIRPADFRRIWNMQENRVHERARPRLHGLHKRLVAKKQALVPPPRQLPEQVWVWEYPWWRIIWRQLWVLRANKRKIPLLQLRRFHHKPLVWSSRGLISITKTDRKTVKSVFHVQQPTLPPNNFEPDFAISPSATYPC